MSRRPACMAALLLALAGPVRAQSSDSVGSSPFRPARAPRAERGADGLRPAGARLLAATGGLSHPGHPGSRAARAPRPRDDPLRQSQSGFAALRLAVSRAEHLRAGQRDQSARSARPGLPRIHLRFLVQELRGRTHPGARAPRAPRGAHRRLRHHDAGEPAAAARTGAVHRPRHRLAVHRARLRRGAHGTRWDPLRARPVVSARRGVRRRARLEPRALHRWRRVLSRVRALRRRPHGAGDLRRGRDRRAAQCCRGADGHPACPPRQGPELGDACRHHQRGRGRRRSAYPTDLVRDAHVAVLGGQCPGLRLWSGAGLPVGRKRVSPHAGSHALPLVGAGVGGSQPDGARCGAILQRAVVSVPLCAHHQHRGPDRGDGVPDDHLLPALAEPGRAAVGAGSRAGTSVGSHDRRLERAALPLDG